MCKIVDYDIYIYERMNYLLLFFNSFNLFLALSMIASFIKSFLTFSSKELIIFFTNIFENEKKIYNILPPF